MTDETESNTTEKARRQAWQERCTKLEALGVDPSSPMPTDEDGRLQVQAILKEYEIAIGNVIPVPPHWEGSPPINAINTLPALAEWLTDQWRSTTATEMGGDRYKVMAVEQAAKAVRNGIRLLASLGVEDRPAHPMPPETVADAKKQIDDLERWVRKKFKDGWQPPKPNQPNDALAVPAEPAKHRKRFDSLSNAEISQFLDKHPGAPISDVAKASGWSQGTVQQSEAWKNEMLRRDATKSPLKKTPIQLTDEIAANLGKRDNMDDVDAQLDYELDFRMLMERSLPEERGRL
jgi:hypothetical protein